MSSESGPTSIGNRITLLFSVTGIMVNSMDLRKPSTIRKITHKAGINIVKQYISNDFTLCFACCNIRFQKYGYFLDFFCNLIS